MYQAHNHVLSPFCFSHFPCNCTNRMLLSTEQHMHCRPNVYSRCWWSTNNICPSLPLPPPPPFLFFPSLHGSTPALPLPFLLPYPPFFPTHTQHTVPPALPSDVRVSNTTSSQVQVTWSLTHQHVDERAESLTVTVTFSNGTIAQQYQLEGSATQHTVDTVPGMEYRVTVSASNQDGTNTTDPVSFRTQAGGEFCHY